MGEHKFCYNCMEKYDAYRNLCPHCGYDENSPHNPMYIAPGTILRDRYLIGVLLSYNGEGATYLSYDKVMSCKVLIREYMPINLCTRVKDKPIISVNYNNLAKYKAFMAEYTELNKALARLRNNTIINPILDMFAENNTTYTVFEHIEGMKLLDYLKENAGELSWEQVSRLFPPLFTTIGILHNAGIIHRAISPDTIYITSNGELRLSGFCISAVRTANAGLEYELFRGYAAPEQYSASSSSRQGSWTDVYSISALLYRILTGCMPTDSMRRLQNDDLCEPRMLNGNIPPHVSRVIMEGMNLSGRDRIQTVTEFVTRLFEQPSRNDYPVQNQYQDYDDNGYNGGDSGYYQQQDYNQQNYSDDVYYQNDYQENEPDAYEEDYRYEKVNAVDKIKVPVIIAILLFAVLMIIAVAFLKVLGGDEEENSSTVLPASTSVSANVVEGTTETTTETTTEETDSIMFDLKGKYFENTKEKYKNYFTLEAIYEFNDQYEKDQIFEQSLEPGAPFRKGDKITVKVSKGKSSAQIPDFKDCTITQYEQKLKEAGITEYSLIAESTSTWGTPNTVTQLQVDGKRVNPGDTFNNSDNKKLIVYYLSPDAVIVTQPPTTEPPTEAPTTEPPTEAPTEAPTPEPEQSTDPPEQQPEGQDPAQGNAG